jgi:hypothetical protein
VFLARGCGGISGVRGGAITPATANVRSKIGNRLRMLMIVSCVEGCREKVSGGV